MKNRAEPYLVLFEDVPDLIQALSPDRTFLYVNDTWSRTLGYTREEAESLNFLDLVIEDQKAEVRRLFHRLEEGAAKKGFETILEAKNGDFIAIEGSWSTRVDSDGEQTVLGIFRDVSSRKRAEEVLTRQAADLVKASKRLKEKDRELAETLDQARQYREAQERAHELSQINEALKGEIGRRRKAEEAIRRSLAEKEVLLKEIHHRVKNNLQIVSSLLNLQADQIADAPSLEMFRESQDRIQSMALIHEKLYQSDDLARVDFTDYIQSLVRYLVRTYQTSQQSIEVRVDVGQERLGLDTAIPCGLIVNELLSNSLKHAFEEGSGEVYVLLESDGDRHVLTVGDNGVGFPADLDFRKTDSLGLQLVNTLSKQLRGTLELNRDQGTEFRIDFYV